MTEAREGLPRTSKSGGEIDTRSSLNGWERDDLGSQYRDRDELIRKRKKRLGSRKPITKAQLAAAGLDKLPYTPEPPPDPLRKGWNQEMVRPIDKSGNYRRLDPDLIKPKR